MELHDAFFGRRAQFLVACSPGLLGFLVRIPLAESDVCICAGRVWILGGGGVLCISSFSLLQHPRQSAHPCPVRDADPSIAGLRSLVTCFRALQANRPTGQQANTISSPTRFGLHRADWGFWDFWGFWGFWPCNSILGGKAGSRAVGSHSSIFPWANGLMA